MSEMHSISEHAQKPLVFDMPKRGMESIIKSRRSQITVFILVGLVLLAIFALMFSATSAIKKAKIEKEIDIAAEKIRETNMLKQYVGLCLKDSLQEGLVLIGKQGGKIYKSQAGIMNDSEGYFRHDNYKINYGIKSNIEQLAPFSTSTEYPEPPEYPCENTQDTASYPCEPSPYNYLINPIKIYPFGTNNLPALCDPDGPNSALLGIFPFPCPTGTYGPDSVQEQLNSFIAAKLVKCVNLEPIEKITQIEITSGKPNVSVIFGEDDVVARATYPLNMSIGRYSSMRFFDFEDIQPVRIKKIFGIADFIAKNDVYDISFSAARNFPDYRYFGKEVLPSVNVSRYCPKCDDSDYTELIEINDSISVVEGKPYSFRFAVENRIPALDPIPAPRQSPAAFDFAVQEGGLVPITPKGYDPDEDNNLSYDYLGWKADKDARFDPVKCFDNLDVCRSNPYYAVVIMTNVPYVWQNSGPYLNPLDPADKERNAEYKTKTKDEDPVTTGCDPAVPPCTKYSRDLGAHNTTVKVCDEEGLCDWQDVKILVMDIPSPRITFHRTYDDVAEGKASIEDPFVLDSSGSCIYCAYASYSWEDSYNDFSFTVPYDIADIDFNGKITIPEYPDIETIKTAQNSFITIADDHVLTLTIPPDSADSNTKTVDVRKCLPHKRYVNKNTAPYPYNDNSIYNNPRYTEGYTDPFQADHVCCDNYNYEPATKSCYVYDSYGSYFSFNSDIFSQTMDGRSIQKYDIRNIGSADDINKRKNDIFRRQFERSCSSDRGNICSGDAYEKITLHKPCADFDDNNINRNYNVNGAKPNAAATQTERCEGINPVFRSQESTTSLNTCSIFSPGKTFETEFGIARAAGNCSKTPACSSGQGDNTFGVGGNFRCSYSQCDGDSSDTTHCDVGMDCSCSQICGADIECSGLGYDLVKNGYRQIYTPAAGSKKVLCGSECKVVEPDLSFDACNWADDKTPGDFGKAFDPNLKFEPGINGKCCGDDNNEFYTRGIDGSFSCCNMLNECVIGSVCQNRLPESEKCDNIDNDCNGKIDEGCDDDRDGYCDRNMVVAGIPSVCGFGGGDCNDNKANMHPGAAEICGNGFDENCDGIDPSCS